MLDWTAFSVLSVGKPAVITPSKNDPIDAVVIVTRTDSHYVITKKFLESGIHVSSPVVSAVLPVARALGQIR